MNNTQKKTLKNATGKIDYTLLNDCMFRTVMQRNRKVLKGLVCALLHLRPGDGWNTGRACSKSVHGRD